MMRVALDVRPLQNESGARGVGRYVRSLIGAMPQEEEEFLYLESRWLAAADLPRACAGRRLRLLRPSRAITVFDQIATPFLCAREKIDVFHSTFYALPRLRAPRTRWVMTVHDLIPVILPGAVGRKNTAIFREIFRSARGADAVIVPSARTARDLEERIGVVRERIRIIPMGVGPPFLARDSAGTEMVPSAGARSLAPSERGALSEERVASEPGGMREQGAVSERGAAPGARIRGSSVGQAPGARQADSQGWSPEVAYAPIVRLREKGAKVLLYVGGFDPTKNVPFLFEALSCLADAAAVLCLAGDPGAAGEGLRAALSHAGLDKRVVWLGRLSEEDLAAAYRTADLFVTSSLYEGFGLPPLEAMACGCPVVALSAGPVPEVLAEAAIGVDERSPEAFAAAIRHVIESEEVRRDRIARGLGRARALSWEATARATLDLYREIAGTRRVNRGKPPAGGRKEGDT